MIHATPVVETPGGSQRGPLVALLIAVLAAIGGFLLWRRRQARRQWGGSPAPIPVQYLSPAPHARELPSAGHPAGPGRNGPGIQVIWEDEPTRVDLQAVPGPPPTAQLPQLPPGGRHAAPTQPLDGAEYPYPPTPRPYVQYRRGDGAPPPDLDWS